MLYNINFEQYLSYFSYYNIRINDVIEILIFMSISFYLIKHFQNTRMWILLKGILTLFIFYAISNLLSLNIITNLFHSLIMFLAIALIMMFQPELRKLLESVGKRNISTNIRSLFKKDANNKRFSEQTIQEIVSAVDIMSKAKTGALILIENEIPLDEYIKTGISINSDITSQLITNIFEKNTPLHDGAMIIRDNKIVSATCYLPLSESKSINKSLGTRHRAGIGASEQTDALVIIVSEETGAISYVSGGKIKHNVSSSALISQIQSINYITKPITTGANKESYFKNILMATFAGCFIWLLLSIVYNPVETVTIKDIPVEIINEQIIENLGKVYEVEGNQTVNIKVTGTKDVVNKLTVSDFTARADLSKLSITNTANIQVTTFKNITVDTGNAVMQINIEDASELELNVELQKVGTEQTGYFVYNLATDTPTISISGPKSIIKTIDKAVATVNVNGAHSNFETTSEIVIYDKNGNIIKPTLYDINTEQITITASIYSTKEVPIVLNIVDDSKDTDLEIFEQTLSSETIFVTAPDNELEKINDVVITVDVTNSSSNTINSIIDLRNYLPSGVQCAGDANLEYTIQIGKFITRELSISPANIEIINGNGRITSGKTRISVTFDKNTTDNISISSFKPYLDIEGLEPGKYTLPLQFKNLNEVKIDDIYNVNVIVEEPSDDEDE